jgi:Uma2 family endonuclease
MDVQALVSEQEYLHSSFEVDCELVDGRLLERNVGEREHSILQGELFAHFWSRRKEWGIRAFPEQRIRIAKGRYRIPDICVYKEPAPREKVFTSPPFIAIEILSSEDRMSRVRQRINDFLRFGTPYVWVIDPDSRRADVYTPEAIYEAKDLILRTQAPDIEIPLAELFREIDA